MGTFSYDHQGASHYKAKHKHILLNNNILPEVNIHQIADFHFFPRETPPAAKLFQVTFKYHNNQINFCQIHNFTSACCHLPQTHAFLFENSFFTDSI